MKKSKIIVPALALLTLSAAASVSGSVAWFTANRTFNFDAGTFAVVSTKDNLDCTLTAGLGTETDGIAIAKDTTINSGNISLTDASFDHANEKFVIPDADGKNVDRVIPLASAALGNANSGVNLFREANVYSAFTWHMDFAISFAANASKDIGLFFNAKDSYASSKVITTESSVVNENVYFMDAALKTAATLTNISEGKGTLAAGTYYRAPVDTGKGFRVAFVPETVAEPAANNVYINNTKKTVWAPNQSGTRTVGQASVNNVQYASSVITDELDGEEAGHDNIPDAAETLASKATDYAADSATFGLIDASTSSTAVVPGDGAAGAVSTAENCLGVFTYSGNTGKTVHLKFQVVVWYEGTDPTIINTASTVYEEIASHFDFGAANMYVA